MTSPALRGRGATGRADLLRSFALLRAADARATVAGLLGYDAVPAAPDEPEMERGASTANKPAALPAPTVAPVVEIEQRPRVSFWRQVGHEAKTLVQQAVRQEYTDLCDDADMQARDVAPPDAPPLQPWRRLGPYLRHVLGGRLPGKTLDERRLVREWARGRVLRGLPRRLWAGWAGEVVVLVDHRPALGLFSPDVQALVGRLEKQRGAGGLRVFFLGLAEEDWLALPPFSPGVPVLALGDLGRLDADAETTRRWLLLGRKLRRLGHPMAALSPCPRERWSRVQAAVWPSAVWDRGQRLPRGRRGWRPLAVKEQDGTGGAVARLLAFLSPAMRIEPGLLRSLRYMVPMADVGMEFDVWNHAHLARDHEAAAWRTDRAPIHRERLAKESDAVRGSVTACLTDWHRHFSPVFEDHVTFAAEAAGAPVSEVRWRGAEARRRRVLATMAHIARHDDRTRAESFGLGRLFALQLARMSPAERRREWVGRAYARWIKFAGPPKGERPAGIDGKVVEAELNDLIEAPARETRWVVRQVGEKLAVVGEGEETEGAPLAGLAAAREWFGVRVEGSRGDTHTHELMLSRKPWQVSVAQARRVVVEGDLARVELVNEPRPSWASRMGRDRYGLYADVELAERVALRLRWIPPGRFLMGSPDDEVGRSDNEGPRHEVTISSGFWLAAMPITRAQWRAVMGGKAAKGEKPDKPVVEVDWAQARKFGAELAERYPELVWDLPSEAEWEYACRAGTETAFNDGSACTVPDGDDPALEALKEAKRPNAWGLRQMHGSVWQWCLDGQRSYRDVAVVDPLGPEKGDYRVVRGGCWVYHARNCRSAYRYRFEPGYRLVNLGFRLAAGQELESSDGARGRAAEEGRDAPTIGQTRRGVRRARPWAQRFTRDEFGVRLEFTLHDAPDTPFVWRWIPRGVFTMGSPEDEAGRWDWEGPQHEVTISRGFWLGATPVTQAQWEAVLGEKANESNFKGATRPVENVAWQRCLDYAGELNRLMPGLGARLPSEAEWEYACRAGTRSAFNDGSACTVPGGRDPALEALGWYGKNSDGQTQPVGQKRPNGWGLHDMHGNVWEWCADWWEDRYPGGARVDPLGPEKGARRVVRGGSWISHARLCRSASRRRTEPGYRSDRLGFRLAAGPELQGGAPEEERSGRRAGEGAEPRGRGPRPPQPGARGAGGAPQVPAKAEKKTGWEKRLP